MQLGDFRRFCDSLTTCLRRVENKLPDGTAAGLRYRIVDLSSGSASLTLEPIRPAKGRDRGPEAIDLFSKTVVRIQAGRPVDPCFNNDDLLAFRLLADPINRKVKEIKIANTQVDFTFHRERR